MRGETVVARYPGHDPRGVEGPSWRLFDLAPWARALFHFCVVVACTGFVRAVFTDTSWALASRLMLVSAAVMVITAVIGSWFFPDKRPELTEQLRHFLFQIMLLPSTAVAGILWLMRTFGTNPDTQDHFLGLLHNSLPIIFLFTVVIPAVIFVKMVASLPFLDRSRVDDEEAIRRWMRQDPYVA